MASVDYEIATWHELLRKNGNRRACGNGDDENGQVVGSTRGIKWQNVRIIASLKSVFVWMWIGLFVRSFVCIVQSSMKIVAFHTDQLLDAIGTLKQTE